MAAPNIVNVTTITGKTAVLAVTTTAAAIVSNTPASNKVIKVNALYIANISNLSGAISVDIFRNSTAYRLVASVSVPSNSTIDLITKALYLEEGDTIRVTAGANSSLEAVCSFEEIS
jgi:hypothetical protein